MKMHSFIFCCRFFSQLIGCAGAYPSGPGATPVYHTGTNKQPLAPTVNLEFPQITSHSYFWSVGGSQRAQRRTHRHRGQPCKLHTEGAPRRPPGIQPTTFLLFVTHHRVARHLRHKGVFFLQPLTSEPKKDRIH